MLAEDALVGACGFVGAACFASMMIPQILLNRRRQSTEGLSLGLVALWHLGAVFYIAYVHAEDESLWILFSMGSFVVTNAVLEAQAIAYPRQLAFAILPMAMGLSTLSIMAGVLLGEVLRVSPRSVLLALGSVVPAALFALGFLPQFHEFVSRRSIEGYSLFVSLFDVLGSAANTVVIFHGEVHVSTAFASSAPFLSIIVLHAVLLSIAALVVSQQRAPRQQESLATIKVELALPGGSMQAVFVDAVEIQPTRNQSNDLRTAISANRAWKPLGDEEAWKAPHNDT